MRYNKVTKIVSINNNDNNSKTKNKNKKIISSKIII